MLIDYANPLVLLVFHARMATAGFPRPGAAILSHALLDGQHEPRGLGHCPGRGRAGEREGGRDEGREG